MITISFGKELTLEAIFKEDIFQRASLGHYQCIPEIDAYAVLEEDSVMNEKSLLSIERGEKAAIYPSLSHWHAQTW